MIQNSQYKLTTERCATLMGVAIANRLHEVWVCKSIVLQLMYLRMYYPNLGILYVIPQSLNSLSLCTTL